MLVAFSSPDLSLLLPTPLPPSLQAVSNSKYPFTALRKSLRLFLDENPEELADVENDISFAYSVYAPVSVRLVQCIAQKAGVLSNPAEKERTPSTTDEQLTAKPQAHPIVGWKGFEDVVQSIPGKTFDISTRTPDSSATVTSQPGPQLFPLYLSVHVLTGFSSTTGAENDDSRIFLGRMYVRRDRCFEMDRPAKPGYGRYH